MAQARANGIDIEYESIGREDAPALLLVMGLGGQLVAWDEELCARLAAIGLRVIRFDNRDVGLSTKLDEHGTPNIAAAMAAKVRGDPVPAPYGFEDMADDTAGLLDALDIAAAHVVGASLGGMVAQVFALRHPDRTLSLTSIMSTTNDRELPGPTPAAIQHLMRPPTEDRDEIIRRAVAGNRIMAGRFPGDEARIRERAGRAFDRCFHPAGTARQMLASIAAESRTDALAELHVPALVIHGSEDPLVPVACGIATAKAIPNAQLEIVDGMGHDLPREAWSRIVAAIAGVVDRAAAQ